MNKQDARSRSRSLRLSITLLQSTWFYYTLNSTGLGISPTGRRLLYRIYYLFIYSSRLLFHNTISIGLYQSVIFFSHFSRSTKFATTTTKIKDSRKPLFEGSFRNIYFYFLSSFSSKGINTTKRLFNFFLFKK